jgi:serine protease Do
MSLHRILPAMIVMSCAMGWWPATASADRSDRRDAIVRAVEKARPAVVNIQSERTAQGPVTEEYFPNTPSQNRSNGMGTGIIVDPRGYIVTNHHVVEDVSVIRVHLHDGSSHVARIVARNQENDLALMKIDTNRPLTPIRVGTSSDLMVGETVIAIGNAYGYTSTVTRGIISALNRDVSLNKTISYKMLIQTDAPINPGNSGGPLLNIDGDLIGVNVAIRAGAQGIAFAIPVDQMVFVVGDMMARLRRNGVSPGLTYRNRIDPMQSPPRFLEVDRVDPFAARAGLRTGDVIVRVGEVPVASGIDLERALLDARPGDTLLMRVRRGDKESQVELPLPGGAQTASGHDPVWRRLGVRLSPANPTDVARINAKLRGGMIVLEVDASGPAARAGLQRGDILVGLHQWETINLDNVVYVLNHPELVTFLPLEFFVLRGGQVHKGKIALVD